MVNTEKSQESQNQLLDGLANIMPTEIPKTEEVRGKEVEEAHLLDEVAAYIEQLRDESATALYTKLAQRIRELESEKVMETLTDVTINDQEYVKATYKFDDYEQACDIQRGCIKQGIQVMMSRSDDVITLDVYQAKGNADFSKLTEYVKQYKKFAGKETHALDSSVNSESRLFSQFEIEPSEIQCLAQGQQFILKIPIARIAKWEHSVYGTLEYTQQTFDQIKEIYQKNALGYKPPLYLGHPGTGAPKYGSLIAIEQEGDTLFGYWNADKDVYRDVQDGKYEYSSSEFIVNLPDKKTGEQLGMALAAIGLTNEPFIPNLPPVQCLENTTIEPQSVFTLSEVKVKHMEKELNQEVVGAESVSIPESNKLENIANDSKPDMQGLDIKLVALEQQLKTVEGVYKQQLDQLVNQNKELTARIEVYEKRIKDEEMQQKLDYISSLTLPTEVKEQYLELIKNDQLGAAEKSVMESLQKLSQTFQRTELLTQMGDSSATADMNDPDATNPYAEVIKQNKERVAQLSQRREMKFGR